MILVVLCTPRALLLDFGGVIVDAPRIWSAPEDLVPRLAQLVGGALTVEAIAADLATGEREYAAWRDAVSAQEYPVELTHAQVWDDFVTPRWPAPARDAVRREATPLSYAWTQRPDWQLRPGIVEVLAAAATGGIPVAIVSNTLCGAAHRDFLARSGLTGSFAAQFYSDEAGVRKPNPELIWKAARAVGMPAEECWYVGDSVLRDVVCGRRARVGAAILMRSPRTGSDPSTPGVAADALVDDGHGLYALLAGALGLSS